MNNNNNKKNKWTPEWDKEIIRLVGGKKEAKELKKGEVKPDGSLVTTDQEKIETNDFELLLGQIKQQKEIIKTKKAELDKKQGYAEEAKQILKEIKELDPKVKEWAKFASWFESAYTRFLNGGTGGYGTGRVGWKALLETYLKSKYKKVANTSPSETNNATATEDYGSNLYEFSTSTEKDSSKSSSWRITENEVVKLITRTVKEIGEIDYDKFVAFTNAHAHPLSTNTSEIDQAEYTASKLQGYLKDLQDRAKCLVDNTIKTENHPDKGKSANGHRLEYSFGQDYTKLGTNTPIDSGNFTDQELIGLFRLMRACQDSTWNSQADFKAATAGVKDDTLIVLPAKTNPMTKSDFNHFTPEDLGIPVDSNGKSNFYATDYGDKISDEDEEQVEYSWETQKELKIEGGIEGWAKLIHGITHTGYNDYTNRQRLISSFTNDPVRQLFTDIRSYVQKDNSLKTDKDSSGTTTPDYACFGSGTDRWTYHEFPDFATREESRLNEYETEKASLLESVKTGRESLKTVEKEYQEAKKELIKKKKEVDNKITEVITAKRKELKEKFKVSDAETNDFTNDNKITTSDHYKFQKLVKDIRFLVKNDAEQPTGQTNEDQAYQASQEIVLKTIWIWHQASWDSIGWIDGNDEANQKRTDEERIAVIKANKNGKYEGGLNAWHDQLVELEKLVKLTDREQQIKDDLKKAIDNQTPEENAKDWQNSLKTIEAGLETAFTEDKINQWKEKKDGQSAFNTITSVNSLLKKVCQDNKVNEDFLTFLKGKDAELINLQKLIEKKEPKEVILLIHQWEYNKLDDTKKAEKHLRYAWSELGGKQKVDSYELTDEDKKVGGNFEKFLYECAIGKINYNSLEKPTERQEDESPTTENKGAIAWLNENYWWPVWVPMVIVAGGAAIFWKQISEWWNGPTEETGEEQVNSEAESEDEQE